MQWNTWASGPLAIALNNWAQRERLRRTLIATAAACVLPVTSVAQAQWPNGPIKLIVPFAAGGSNDNIARMLGTNLGARLGQPFVIENKGGGGGTIGTDAVAKSPADGNTLLFASTSITTMLRSSSAVNLTARSASFLLCWWNSASALQRQIKLPCVCKGSMD